MTRGRQVALGFTALAVLVVAVLVGRSVVSSPKSAATKASATTPATTTTAPGSTTAAPPTTTGAPGSTSTGADQYPPAGYDAFSDDPAGYEIAYPKTWTRLRPKDNQVDLLVAQGSSTTNGVSMLVRVSPLPRLGLKGPVTRANLPKIRSKTDLIIHAGGFAHVIGHPKAVVLDGVPGYLYLYTFTATPGQPAVAHAHYLLFKHGALIAIVFQVTPAQRLATLAPTLDQVARTFRATTR